MAEETFSIVRSNYIYPPSFGYTNNSASMVIQQFSGHIMYHRTGDQRFRNSPMKYERFATLSNRFGQVFDEGWIYRVIDDSLWLLFSDAAFQNSRNETVFPLYFSDDGTNFQRWLTPLGTRRFELHPSDQLQSVPKLCTEFHVTSPAQDFSHGLTTLLGAMTSYWQDRRVLRVRFLNGDPVVQKKIEIHAMKWCDHCGMLFDFGNHADAEIRINIDASGRSDSYVGSGALTVPKDKPTMNFGWLSPASSDSEYSRVVLHEFGHALGFVHEHLHPDSGIPWDKDAVYAYYAKQNPPWDKSQVDENIFKAYDRTKVNFTQYDPMSIMHYAVPNSLTHGEFEIPWNTALSDLDRKFVAEVYPKDSSAELSDALRRVTDCWGRENRSLEEMLNKLG